MFSLFHGTFLHLITNGDWFFAYSILFGLWVSLVATIEVNEKLEGHFYLKKQNGLIKNVN